MKIYRTTCYSPGGGVGWIRYGTTKVRFSAAKSSWFYDSEPDRRRITLEMVEIPEDAWEMIGDTDA